MHTSTATTTTTHGHRHCKRAQAATHRRRCPITGLKNKQSKSARIIIVDHHPSRPYLLLPFPPDLPHYYYYTAKLLVSQPKSMGIRPLFRVAKAQSTHLFRFIAQVDIRCVRIRTLPPLPLRLALPLPTHSLPQCIPVDVSGTSVPSSCNRFFRWALVYFLCVAVSTE